MELKSVCVYCGSSAGERPEYFDEAHRFGRLLAARGIRLVYGGASVGLMGAVADAALAAGGEVVGVIPHALVAKEIAHAGLTDLVVTGSMHERKARMAELSDGFVALPGGIGTFEELFEAWTWAQLGIHHKPCALLNVAGYYDRLVAFLEHAAGEGFMRRLHRSMLLVARQPEELLEAFAAYRPPEVETWVRADET
ncbi:TIGR00730 family Rossman fold protein [Methylococcus sp. ANG]|uniref:LOG family protein n=1 Tax=unclassified Methylococcus TaxID=2618889 RepID=UPI001C52C361|nr:TIGR00730 family Rossman fold protein [Methylococcus sp. Mc7]QXP83657.1 TIGR00730 family Rossman fold protein [Methylococcus sp. Mc7]